MTLYVPLQLDYLGESSKTMLMCRVDDVAEVTWIAVGSTISGMEVCL